MNDVDAYVGEKAVAAIETVVVGADAVVVAVAEAVAAQVDDEAESVVVAAAVVVAVDGVLKVFVADKAVGALGFAVAVAVDVAVVAVDAALDEIAVAVVGQNHLRVEVA
jgi:hypothetical protein